MDIPEVVREFIEDLYSPTDSLEEMKGKLIKLLESQDEDEREELSCDNCGSDVTHVNSVYCNDCYEQNGDCNGDCSYVEEIREKIGEALNILKNA